MSITQTIRYRADQVMGQMVQELKRVFPGIRLQLSDSGPECEDGIITVYIPEVAGIDWEDLSESVPDVVDAILNEARQGEDLTIFVHTAREEKPADNLLATRLIHQHQLHQRLIDVYTTLRNADSEYETEFEMYYYPQEGIDADIIVHGASEEVMARLRNALDNLIKTQASARGLNLRIHQGKTQTEWLAEQERAAAQLMNPQRVEKVPLKISADMLAVIEQIAGRRMMAPEALIRLYIEQGLQQDLRTAPFETGKVA